MAKMKRLGTDGVFVLGDGLAPRCTLHHCLPKRFRYVLHFACPSQHCPTHFYTGGGHHCSLLFPSTTFHFQGWFSSRRVQQLSVALRCLAGKGLRRGRDWLHSLLRHHCAASPDLCMKGMVVQGTWLLTLGGNSASRASFWGGRHNWACLRQKRSTFGDLHQELCTCLHVRFFCYRLLGFLRIFGRADSPCLVSNRSTLQFLCESVKHGWCLSWILWMPRVATWSPELSRLILLWFHWNGFLCIVDWLPRSFACSEKLLDGFKGVLSQTRLIEQTPASLHSQQS